MNTGNLQLEGLYLALAAVMDLMVKRGLLEREDLQAALAAAERTAERDAGERRLSAANGEAMLFPIKLLRLATELPRDTVPRFADLARELGESKERDGA
jgi:hypothetical protein